MNFLAVVETVFPVFVLIAVGYGFGAVRQIDLFSLTEIVVYLGGPALVFTSLAGGHMEPGDVALTAFGTAFIVGGVGLLLRACARLSGRDAAGLYLPAMFFNAGNMLLPLSLFAFGQPGLRYGVIVFSIAALLQSSLGVAIASGRVRLDETFKLPYVYAAVAGLALQYTGSEVPRVVMRPLALLAELAVPLMLISLGLRLRSVSLQEWRGPAVAATFRLVGGYLVGRTFVDLFGVEGIPRDVLLLASVMPAAVVNFVFAEKYGNESGIVAGAVVVSTVVSAIAIPLVLAFGI